MADDKSKSGKGDRSKVAAGEKYEVDYVAKKFGVTADVVRQVIKEVGNERVKIEEALRKRKP